MPDGLQLATSVDLSAYDLAVLRYVRDLHLDGPRVVRFTGRLLAEELIRVTPPKTLAQGRAAVARDIGYAMWAIDPAKIHNSILRLAVQDQEFEVVQAFMANLRKVGRGGELNRYRLEHFSRTLHQRARNRRGRVPRSRGIIVLERSEHSRYVKEIQGHVGSAKFIWGVGAQRMGATVPGWILGHSPGLGSVEDNLSNQDNPNLVMTNKAPGVDSISVSLIQRAVSIRERAMTRDVDRVLAGGASKYFD
jgi:hypothetical protein